MTNTVILGPLPITKLNKGSLALAMTAVAVALIGTALFVASHWGIRSDIASHLSGDAGLKFAIGLPLFAACFAWLTHSWWPGAGKETDFVLPLFTVSGLVVAGAVQTHAENGVAAFTAIVGLSIPFMVSLTALTRLFAPTDLCSSSSAIGFTSGGIAVTLYALHCPLTDVPTILFWYGLAIGVTALVSRITLCHFIEW